MLTKTNICSFYEGTLTVAVLTFTVKLHISRK